MTKWEHKKVFLLSPLPDPMDNLMVACDKLGAEGWQLAAVVTFKQAVFKRPEPIHGPFPF